MDANDRITRIKKDSVGEQKIKDLYINGEQVPVVSSMKKNGVGEITELYLNEIKQTFPESGSVNAFETLIPCFILNDPTQPDYDFPFVFINADGTFCSTLEEVPSAKFAFNWYAFGGTAVWCYRTNSTDEWPYRGGDLGYYINDCIFTISEGVISLPDEQDPLTTHSYSIRLPNDSDGWLKDGFPLSSLMTNMGS